MHALKNQSASPVALVSDTISCNIFERPSKMFKGAKLLREIPQKMYIFAIATSVGY